MVEGDKFRILERITNANDREMDRAVLRNLEAAGADLRLPTHTIFYFYFPSEQVARSAGQELEREGFRIDVHPAPAPWWKRLLGRREWSCLADRVLVLEQQAVFDRSDRFRSLAARLGGQYDGFEAAVTKSR
jgi:hypothetical protein